MSTVGATSSRSGVIAGAWVQGDAWRIVAVAGGPTPRVVGTDSVSLADAGGLRKACETLGATHIVGVAKAASCVTKTVELPAGSDEELSGALALMSEAELPGSLPPHRCAGGRLPGRGVAGGLQAALLIGLASTPEHADGIDTWTGETAALTYLLAPSGCGVVVDRSAASIASVARGPEGWLIRGFRAAADDANEWNQETSSAARIASGFAGCDPPPSQPGERWVWLDDQSRDALRTRVSGVSLDEQWLSRFAVPLGAALGAITAQAAAQPLFDLRLTPPREQKPLLTRVGSWLAEPTHALTTLLVCAVIAAAAPLAAAWIDYQVLRGRVATIEAAIEDAGGEGWLDADRRAALYGALQEQRWPMTKLTADLARALPVGADIAFLEIKTGDAVMVRGYADSLELVNTFAEALNGSGVFRDFVTNNAQVRDEPGSGRPIEFELRGAVWRPYASAEGVDDFAENPLAVRMYGERGRLVVARTDGTGSATDDGDAAAADATPSAPSGDGDDGTATASSGSSSNNDRRSIFDSGDDDQAEAQNPVPEPLTDEALAGMDRRQVQREWITRQNYAKKYRDSLDPEVVERLEQEAERAKARVVELKDAG